MRATISFEADVSRVNDIMRSLVLEETNALQDAFMSLEKATADRIVEGISDALAHIYGVARQLEQYQQMMVSFEQARFQTMVPQSAGVAQDLSQVREAAETMKKFDNFIEAINEEQPDESQEG
mgnify:CR=1 FL=1|tara:strand:+ start:68 stop:436 length:369 start_codon:yes stop_codon:yes gene_type:complete